MPASDNFGGGIYAQETGQVVLVNSVMLDNFADDSGGAIFLDTGDTVGATLDGTLIKGNYARGLGCAVSVGREAFLKATDSIFSSNGGISSTGKNEKGGGVASAEGRVTLVRCRFVNNTAIIGGALYAEQGSTIAITSTEFLRNSADQIGGAIEATRVTTITIEGESNFAFNDAASGGAIAMTDQSSISVSSATFTNNVARVAGGAIYVETRGFVRIESSAFAENSAVLGGAVYVKTAIASTITDSLFSQNNASARGGAFYFEEITRNTTTSAITCQHNVAASGGCMFWLTYDNASSTTVPPLVPCVSCVLLNNSLYDIATNTRTVGVLWWPSNVYSGLAALELPDEESFKPMETLNLSKAQLVSVWPRLKALDLYDQVEVLDAETACIVKPVHDSDGAFVDFRPMDLTTAVAGVILYEGATFKGEATSKKYTLNMTCSLPKREKDMFFLQSVSVLPCEPGYSIESKYVASA